MSTWPQCAMLYDGSFAGFLSCVNESFRQKVYPFYFLPPHTQQVSPYPLLEVPTDPTLAKALYQDLKTRFSHTFQQLITYSFLTCLPQRERNMFDVIYLAFHHALPQDHTDDRLLVLTRAIQHLVHEAQQYQDVIQFTDYGGVLMGQITPKNQILPLLRPHLCQQLSEKAFLLHDKTNRQALFYADHQWKMRPLDHLDLADSTRDKIQCQALWQQFYKTIAAPIREKTWTG